jgi:hypothetical protein
MKANDAIRIALKFSDMGMQHPGEIAPPTIAEPSYPTIPGCRFAPPVRSGTVMLV